MDEWQHFCYGPVLPGQAPLPLSNSTSKFRWWRGGDFELCIQYLAFITASTALFGTFSMYYAGRYNTEEKRRISIFMTAKILITASIALNSLVELCAAFWLAPQRSYVVLLAECVMTLSWSAHVTSVWVFSHSVVYLGRGPLVLNASWYLTLIASILHFRTVIRELEDPMNYDYVSFGVYFTQLFRVTVYIHMGLQVVYGTTLLFGVKAPDRRYIGRSGSAVGCKTSVLSIQAEEEEVEERVREKQPLLRRSRISSRTYGTLLSNSRDSSPTDLPSLKASEDGANLLSLLMFWWVLPLLRKGALGFLQQPTDLPSMPKKLQTSLIRKVFRKALLKTHHTNSLNPVPSNMSPSSTSVVKNEDMTTGVGGTAPANSFLESEVMLRSFTRSTPVPSSPTPHSAAVHHNEATALITECNQGGNDGAPMHPSTSTTQSSSQDSPRRTSQLFLFWALNRAFGLHYYPLGLLKFTTDLLGFAGPLLLYQLVSFIENKREPMYYGYLFALGLVSSTLVSAFLTSHFTYQVNKVGLKVRGALITEVYRKSLAINLTTLSQYSTGQVINYMSTDTDRIVNFCQSFHQFWSLPFQIGVSLFLLYQQVGLAFLAGAGFCILLIPINRWLAVKIGKLSTQMMAEKDLRVKIISEVLTGIRVVKFYVWEKNFSSKIFKIRQRELKSLMGRKYLDALCVYFWATTPVLISILTFTTYVVLGHHLTAAKVFTSVALFNILISPLNAFPWVINGLMEAWVSTKRVQEFLQLDELDWAQYYIGYTTGAGEAHPITTLQEASHSALSIHSATLTWHRCHTENGSPPHSSLGGGDTAEPGGHSQPQSCTTTSQWRLFNINLFVPPGTLVGVVGKVGAGKSSLLAAITAEMRRVEGQVYVQNLDEGFGLVTQEAWIQQATVKENILFGKEFDPNFYHQVISACALEEDLRLLPAGDETEVGENGVTLSGGQKARLALARAVYQDKQFYLLDDPLAAVDARVATHLYTHCIMGLLRHKTRILCTHHHRFLQDVDWVVVMQGGCVDEEHSGPPDRVLPWLQENLSQVGQEKLRRGVMSKKEEEEEEKKDVEEEEEEEEEEEKEEKEEEEEEGEEKNEQKGSKKEDGIVSPTTAMDGIVSPSAAQDDIVSPATAQDGIPSPGAPTGGEHALVQEEEKEVGVVAFSVYLAYWRAVGTVLAPAVFLALFLMQASRNINDWWLAYWISNSHTHPGTLLNTTTTITMYHHTLSTNQSQAVLREASDNLDFYLGIYGGLATANSVFTLFRAFLYAYGGVCAAKTLHKKLLHNMLRAPTAFYDVTPIGRIINRFSSDIYAIDDSLPFIMNILLAQVYGLLGTIAVTSYGLPWFMVMLVPLGVLYYYIQRFYRRTSRELKRLSSVTLSPVYAHFSETLSGLWTIRSLRAAARFMDDNERRLHINQQANFGSYAVAQWLSLYLQLLGVAMVAGVSFLAVLEHHFSTVDPGLVGLAISYALSVTGLLSGVVTSFTETEKQMVSVERAMQYIHGVPAEKNTGRAKAPSAWPSSGVVEFRDVSLSYRENHLPALDRVSFITQPGEKIGIAGRTGAGKSSLLQAMFRMVEISGGSIMIDGVDISTLPLDTLRSALAVIPQDPFLFSGSVRENIDPCNIHSDQELWSVLERCHLKEAVTDLGGLYSEVEEKGRVFSAGQRQLVCLARALLTRAKVICVDEATANVDLQTDSHIQRTIQKEFTGSTVLTIAHRIETVLHSNRILVMDQGQVREWGPPSQLLQDHNSLFLALHREHSKT